MKKGFFVLFAFFFWQVTLAQRTTTTTASSASVFRDGRDLKSYKTITIKENVWMAENLAYQMGTGYSFNPNGDATNAAEYGLLYRYGVNQPEACPEGWRVPTKDEFESMLSATITPSLTPTNTRTSAGAASPKSKVDLLNEAGFFIKFAGMNAPGEQGAYFNTEFGTYCMFWTSTPATGFSLPHKYAVRIDKASGSFTILPLRADHALSVRCIKNVR